MSLGKSFYPSEPYFLRWKERRWRIWTLVALLIKFSWTAERFVYKL